MQTTSTIAKSRWNSSQTRRRKRGDSATLTHCGYTQPSPACFIKVLPLNFCADQKCLAPGLAQTDTVGIFIRTPRTPAASGTAQAAPVVAAW
jgi:hypothetical protein